MLGFVRRKAVQWWQYEWDFVLVVIPFMLDRRHPSGWPGIAGGLGLLVVLTLVLGGQRSAWAARRAASAAVPPPRGGVLRSTVAGFWERHGLLLSMCPCLCLDIFPLGFEWRAFLICLGCAGLMLGAHLAAALRHPPPPQAQAA